MPVETRTLYRICHLPSSRSAASNQSCLVSPLNFLLPQAFDCKISEFSSSTPINPPQLLSLLCIPSLSCILTFYRFLTRLPPLPPACAHFLEVCMSTHAHPPPQPVSAAAAADVDTMMYCSLITIQSPCLSQHGGRLVTPNLPSSRVFSRCSDAATAPTSVSSLPLAKEGGARDAAGESEVSFKACSKLFRSALCPLWRCC